MWEILMFKRIVFFRRPAIALLAAVLAASLPASSMAQTIREHEAQQAEDAERPFKIESRQQFACAEVGLSETGGATSHEINLTPKYVERCELIKVGTRLHECKKYRYTDAIIDNRGVVKIPTDDGEPVEFWFDEETRITGGSASQLREGGGKGTLTFEWPDKKSFKYLCAAMH